MDLYEIKLVFQEPLLGTVPKNPEVYTEFIKTKAPEGQDTDDELETLEEIEKKGWTGFHLKDGKPILYNYAIKGFCKEACGAMRRVPGSYSHKFAAYKKVINDLLFVSPRQIPINLNGGKMDVLERPLRAMTMKGERVTVTKSDTCPPGSSIEFQIKILGVISKKLLCEWLEYSSLKGFGQWRNAEYGRCDYEIKT
jgi:hypothetical protein